MEGSSVAATKTVINVFPKAGYWIAQPNYNHGGQVEHETRDGAIKKLLQILGLTIDECDIVDGQHKPQS